MFVGGGSEGVRDMDANWTSYFTSLSLSQIAIIDDIQNIFFSGIYAGK